MAPRILRAGGLKETMNTDQLNERQQETWASGDFPKMGVELAIAGEFLCETIPVYAGDRVLDVGTASGNTALSAARRRAKVTAIDLVPSLLERARQRASADGLAVDFQEGDAMALAFPNASFDVVMSTFGAIFAPDPVRTAAEMARVCRPGGKIALAAWTPDGMLGKLFRLLARYAPAELALDAPVEWGEEAKFRKWLGPWAVHIAVQKQAVNFRAVSAPHWVEFMRTYFGPAIRAFDSSTPAARKMLAEEMAALISGFNSAANGTILARSEYLEIVATRS
jgi:ubiquinone/menaquinone biosynthesis C-methylase UbiE